MLAGHGKCMRSRYAYIRPETSNLPINKTHQWEVSVIIKPRLCI